MGMFDYKGLSVADAADLAGLSHALARFSQTDRILGLAAGEIIAGIDAGLGGGAIMGHAITAGLPEGWSEVSAATLGLPATMVDNDGYLRLTSPLTGDTPSGPQLKVLAERDASGAIIGLAISYAGTNSLVDVLDYTVLNEGAPLAVAMAPVLEAVAGYARSLGLSGSDVIVTGYSLGAGMTNIQARYADTLAGGFFADSLYVAHEPPVICEIPGRVLNIGYENDVVHRAAGDAAGFWEAIAAADPLLSNNDGAYASSTDNLVIFDGAYANAGVTLAVDSILNVFGWWAHIGGAFSDAVARIGASAFYEFTARDSVVVVSNLGADLRGSIWVEDKASPTSDHFGAPAFLVGTTYGDLLRDGVANDWIDGGAGDDLIRVSTGLNRVEGGAGTDTLRVIADVAAVKVYRLADGTLAFDTGEGLALARGVEKVEIGQPGALGLIDWTTPFSVMADRLEDDHWSLFEWGDRDIAYAGAVQGGAGNDVLTGRAVFGQDGADRLSGTTGADLLHGGEGQDTLSGGAGNDRLYGAEHADRLVAGAGTDRLNGGHGNDTFVFDARTAGTAIVEDYNDLAAEADILLFTGGHGAAPVGVQSGDDVVFRIGLMTVVLEDTRLADVQNVLVA